CRPLGGRSAETQLSKDQDRDHTTPTGARPTTDAASLFRRKSEWVEGVGDEYRAQLPLRGESEIASIKIKTKVHQMIRYFLLLVPRESASFFNVDFTPRRF